MKTDYEQGETRPIRALSSATVRIAERVYQDGVAVPIDGDATTRRNGVWRSAHNVSSLTSVAIGRTGSV